MNIVALSGSLSHPSRTATLTENLLARARESIDAQTDLVRISDLAPVLGNARDPSKLPPEVAQAQQKLFSADVLVVATPIYKASYTGLLKHFFDLIEPNALRGKLAVLLATGGSELHALALEHQLRPLLSFFGVATVPATIFVRDSSFSKDATGQHYHLTDASVQDRIDAIVEQLPRSSGSRQAAALAAA